MARGNGRTINVKIPTIKVINALESRLTQVKTDYANQDKLEKEYQEAYKTWNANLTKFALSKIDTATNIRTNYRSWNNTLNIDFDVDTTGKDFPQQPERDFEQWNSHAYKETVEEIENAIRILKLTDEETVSTSTYNSIAKYL